MKRLSIGEFLPENIRVVFYTAMQYHPILHREHIVNRKSSSFLYIVRGEYDYRFADGEMTAVAGDILYIPHGTTHFYKIPTEDAFVMQLEFDIVDADSGESIVFSAHPVLAADGIPPSLSHIFEQTVNDVMAGENDLRQVGNLLLLLAAYADTVRENGIPCPDDKLAPAIRYLRTNFTRRIYVRDLAQMCFLSETQFRRLFREKTGETAIGYKNRLLIRTAQQMLDTGYGSIGEIANALGFTSVYTFSRTFKKYTGQSPRGYAARS